MTAAGIIYHASKRRRRSGKQWQFMAAAAAAAGGPGTAMVETVGFRGQTAPTITFEIQTTPTTIYVRTNYQPTGSTDSEAVLMHDEILLSGGRSVWGGEWVHLYQISSALRVSALLRPTNQPIKLF